MSDDTTTPRPRATRGGPPGLTRVEHACEYAACVLGDDGGPRVFFLPRGINKRFCTRECRNAHHSAENRAARGAWHAAKEGGR